MTRAITKVEGSNSLAVLAGRINAEHEASVAPIKRGLEHAVACGRLLIEAKVQLAHGQWLPWLREHCQVPERSAQRYMELAAYAADDAQIRQLADLALDGATQAPLSAEEALDFILKADDWQVAVDVLLGRPFEARDFLSEFCSEGIRGKFKHQFRIPAVAAWCISVTDWTEDNRPAWRLCPWDELIETAKALAPICKGEKTVLRFDAASFDDMRSFQNAIQRVKIEARALVGGILTEIQHRGSINDEQYTAEWNETHRYVMARLDSEKRKRGAPA